MNAVIKFDAAALARNAVAAASAPLDAKRPLYRDMPAPAAFPIRALGPLQAPAEAIQARTQAPIAICAQSVLAAATLAVQAHYDVDLPGSGRRPLTMMFLSIAESGERKSSVDRLALAPVYAYEERLRAAYDGHIEAFKADLAAYKAAVEVAKKQAKNGRAAARTAIGAVGPEPKAPPSPMLLIADPTPEGLTLQLAESRPWGGVFSAEGGLLIGGNAMSDEAKMRTGALFNTLWDGDPIRRRRVLTGTTYLPGRRCSFHLMVQPGAATVLTCDETLRDLGTLARLLIVAPETTAGTRIWCEPPPETFTILAQYRDRLTQFLEKPPVTVDGTDGLDPRVIVLTADATRMLIAFYNAVETNLRPDGELSTIRGFASKMPEHAGRLAAVMAVYADPNAVEVSTEHMTNGIKLVQHYAAEMQRLADGAAIAPDLKLARRLLDWWQGRPDPKCHLATIYQRGLNAIGDAGTARRIIEILEAHGWIARLPAGTVLDGTPRRDAWELRP